MPTAQGRTPLTTTPAAFGGPSAARADVPDVSLGRAGFRELLGLFVATDLLLIATHIVHVLTPYLSDTRYSLETERGFPEIFQYVKLYWLAVSCFWLSWRARERAFAVWGVIFGYLLLDDSFELHEKFGLFLAERFGLPSALGLRAQDFGELAAVALVAAGSFGLLAIAYVYGSLWFRAVTHRLLLLLALLAVFGVGADMLHVAFWHHTALERTLAIIEDGGEMIVVSVLCWYAVGLVLRTPQEAVSRAPETSPADRHGPRHR